ncbi:DUF6087 family protein [Streptomyces sp. URMC 125]|uniref:DUF6087 family protein n=1 Tax=Streptomyces sp. URMC 125 TaxID=3423419 RepID=UPI003F1ADFA9
MRKRIGSYPRVRIEGGGRVAVSQAVGVLLVETVRKAGLDTAISIEEWTGTEWQVVGVVENLAADQALLYPPPSEPAKPAEWDWPAMGKGRGRQGKPTSAEEREQQAARRSTVVTAHQRRSAKTPLRRQAVASRA